MGRPVTNSRGALKDGPDGPSLNLACDTVRRELCESTVLAIDIQKTNGRQDLARQLSDALKSYGCTSR